MVDAHTPRRVRANRRGGHATDACIVQRYRPSRRWQCASVVAAANSVTSVTHMFSAVSGEAVPVAAARVLSAATAHGDRQSQEVCRRFGVLVELVAPST